MSEPPGPTPTPVSRARGTAAFFDLPEMTTLLDGGAGRWAPTGCRARLGPVPRLTPWGEAA